MAESFEDRWAANEERLLRTADSLGGLLEQIRGLFSPRLIQGRGWERLVERAGELPPTLAAFPLWLGFRLDEPRAAAEFIVSLVGGTRSAAILEERGRAADAGRAAAGIAFLLGETGPEKSPLRRAVGDRVLLGYGADPARRNESGDPGIFLYPIRPTLAGGGAGGRLRDFGIVLDAVTAAAGREPDAAERRQVEQAYLALEGETRIGAVGTFPSADRAIEITVLGFAKPNGVTAFLERAGWPGRRALAASTLSRLQERGALNGLHLGVHFEVGAGGLGPALELHVFSQDRMYDRQGWFKDKRCWTAFMEGIGEERLAVAGKLSELAEWSSGAKTLFGKSGPFVALQRIHHFKIVLAGDRIEQVNGYVFLLMCG